MKGIVLLFLILVFSLVGFTQTKSDSLFNTKLYPVENGRFILIGSEKSVSFKNSVIRLYDENLKIIKEIKQKNIRSSDIYLDENLPNEYRIIDRYRWNKGRVKIFDKNLELKSSIFFKRDEYKDWMIKSDEPKNYPLKGEEHLFGLDPIFYEDSLCFYFNKKMGCIEISKMNFSHIKPVFSPIVTCVLDMKGEIIQYKFMKLSDRRLAFYYCMNIKGKRTNFITVIDLHTNADCKLTAYELKEMDEKAFFVSDFKLFSDTLIVAGSYSNLPQELTSVGDNCMQQNMAGFFMTVYRLNGVSIKTVSSYLDSTYTKVEKNIVGFKVHNLNYSRDTISGFFEKFILYKKTSLMGDKTINYPVFESTSVIDFEYNLANQMINHIEFTLNHNPESLKELSDKQWRTFKYSKGQNIHDLIFNGETISGYNDLSIKYSDNHKIIFNDRNDSFLIANWSNQNFTTKTLYLKTGKTKCYFLEKYYVKFTQADWGYKLEKVKY
jgi:hypothetical protein